MLRLSPIVIAASVSLLAAGAEPVFAGAFLMDEGYGQFIAGVGFSEGSRRFDDRGRAVPCSAYRKVMASGYVEYGWKAWLTLIAAPTLARRSGVATNQITGSDDSALGARLSLYRRDATVISFQALLQPPLGGDRTAALADGGARSFASDLRIQFARGFSLGAWQAFAEAAPGVRVRSDRFPNEARLDLTFGLRPIPRLLFLLQAFTSTAPSHGPQVGPSSYTKLQASLVYDISARWSAQFGGFQTIAGRNAIREAGPMAALWLRF